MFHLKYSPRKYAGHFDDRISTWPKMGNKQSYLWSKLVSFSDLHRHRKKSYTWPTKQLRPDHVQIYSISKQMGLVKRSCSIFGPSSVSSTGHHCTGCLWLSTPRALHMVTYAAAGENGWNNQIIQKQYSIRISLYGQPLKEYGRARAANCSAIIQRKGSVGFPFSSARLPI